MIKTPRRETKRDREGAVLEQELGWLFRLRGARKWIAALVVSPVKAFAPLTLLARETAAVFTWIAVYANKGAALAVTYEGSWRCPERKHR